QGSVEMDKVTADEYKWPGDENKGARLAGLGGDNLNIRLEKVLSLYGPLNEESIEALSRVYKRDVELKKNQKVFSLCNEKSDLFLVKEGWVSLAHAAIKRGQDICNIFMPGDIIGLRESFFDNHDVAMLALTNCKLERFSVSDLHQLFRERDEVREAATSYVLVNDNISIERLRSCTHHRSEERVAHFLLEVYERFKFKGLLTSNVFSFPVTQNVVGELLGMTSVHVSRCMTALEQKKLIRKTRSSIKIIQPEEMAKITDFDKAFVYGHVCLH
ncbi:Crp/Fnr family transcriptional regulator, partial [Halomonas sp. GFAJ-1]|uniref:Crp/Fnr family transcriptional regulator n=1 Tax=Halomonas sp. GFAJ-1 TaxID=1118153 RepID=UPI00023A2072